MLSHIRIMISRSYWLQLNTPSGWAEMVQPERAENANKPQQIKKALRGNSDTTKYGHGSLLLHLNEVGFMLAQLCGGGTHSHSR